MLAYLAILILSGWLLYYSVESPYFQVREIAVSGTRLLEASQVQEAAAISGRNALVVRTEAVEQAVARLSAVKEARAVVSLDGRVTVDVAERTPLVQWKAREGSFLVDQDGVVFSERAAPNPVVIVRDLDGPDLEIGSRVDPSVLFSVSQISAVLPARTGVSVPWYEYSRASGVGVPMDGGPRVLFGDAADLESKVAALAAIQEHLEASKSRAELIDLRFKGRPTYVLAPPPPVKPAQTR